MYQVTERLISSQHISDKPKASMPSLGSSTLHLPNWRTLTLRKAIPVLFLPAGIGLLFKIAIAPTPAHRVLAVALAIFCPELTRMAWVDLENIAVLNEIAASSKPANLKIDTSEADSTKTATAFEQAETETARALQTQLQQFRSVVVSTIVLEATGYYLALISLPAGALAIILSQLWFNLLAKVQLYPTQSVPVVPCGPKERSAILAVNVLTVGLLCLWPVAAIQLGLAITLLALISLYLVVKYGAIKYGLFKVK